MSGKGGQFERELCTRLSLWWTAGERDDVLWRSSSSGARATARSKRGKTTKGQYGDIASTDPCSAPLTDLLTWELKRGYQTRTLFDAIDKEEATAVSFWEKVLHQTIATQQKAGTCAWAIVSRRNRRQALIYVPVAFVSRLREVGAWAERPFPSISLSVSVRDKQKRPTVCHVFGTLLDNFFDGLTPQQLLQVWLDWKEADNG